jgi:hypothetical protein
MVTIFDEIAEQSNVQNSEKTATAVADDNSTDPKTTVSEEINFDNLSDVAIGQQKKYERESLAGKTIKIKYAKLFNANKETDTVISAISNPETKYYKTNLLVILISHHYFL